MRAGLLACVLVLLLPTAALAEWQLKPFLGVTFAGSTTFVDLEHASGKPNVTFGGAATLLGGIFGVEGELAYAPGFFQASHQALVVDSGVTTFMGNVVISMPRRWAQYSLRPYVIGGAGVMHVQIDDVFGVLKVDKSLGAIDVGGGVTGFLTPNFGLNWDLRYFRSLGGSTTGVSFGTQELWYWRATMGFTFAPGHRKHRP